MHAHLSIEHQEDSRAGKWEVSGATEHSKDCHERFNSLHPKTLAKLPNIHECKIRESLEINNFETKAEYNKSIKVLNRDRGSIVNTNSWKPLFPKIFYFVFFFYFSFLSFCLGKLEVF